MILLLLLPLIPIYWRGHALLREYERERPVQGATLLDVQGRTITILGKEGPAVYVPLEEITVDLRQGGHRHRRCPFLPPLRVGPHRHHPGGPSQLEGWPDRSRSQHHHPTARKNLFLTTERTLARKGGRGHGL